MHRYVVVRAAWKLQPQPERLLGADGGRLGGDGYKLTAVDP
jgi:hypothetical protein